jgi:hypothetical protein
VGGYLQVLDHVVLDQRVASPSVDGQVAVALGGEAAAVVDGADKMSVRRTVGKKDLRSKHSPTSAWVPSLATDKVAGVPPGDGVAATLQVGRWRLRRRQSTKSRSSRCGFPQRSEWNASRSSRSESSCRHRHAREGSRTARR